MSSCERDAEQHEAGDGQRYTEALEPGERDFPVTRDHDGEDPDAASSSRLHERKRCKRQREHVEQPAARLDAEAEQPTPLS
jgi:hypothetical protein